MSLLTSGPRRLVCYGNCRHLVERDACTPHVCNTCQARVDAAVADFLRARFPA